MGDYNKQDPPYDFDIGAGISGINAAYRIHPSFQASAMQISNCDIRWVEPGFSSDIQVFDPIPICSRLEGYYDYHQPLSARIPGLKNFGELTIHPQFWAESCDYSGKRVVIIGSGATAITLLRKLAERAAKVTMLQRNPSYIVSFSTK